MARVYINSTDYKFKHIYDVNTLKNYSDYAQRDIERAMEVIEKCKAYQLQIHEHYQHVINTEMKPVVVIQRSEDYSSKRIKYYINLNRKPQVDHEHIDGERVYGTFEHSKMFPGSERTQAIKYAKDLAKQYNCEIEKKGFRDLKANF